MKLPMLRTVRMKLLAVVLLTTLVALVVAISAFVAYNLNMDRRDIISDMTTQSELVGHMTAAALIFDDEQLATQNLGLLRFRSNVRAAALYSAQGELFATYVSPGTKSSFPQSPQPDSVRTEGRDLVVYKRIVDKGEVLGTLYLRADHGFFDRFADYAGIAALVTVAAMLIAFLLSTRLQRVVTAPLASIAGISREVVEQRNYSRRAEKTSDDEIGLLVDSFNDMLSQIERRTRELEDSNQEIAREVGERRRAQHEVMRLNGELEARVHDRTAQLEASNAELVRAKESADKANQAKSAFLSSMSHELRTPLNAVLGFTQLMASRSHTITPEKITEFTTHISNAGRHLLELITEVLDLSKIESGTLALNLEPVALADVMLECREMMDPLAKSRGIRMIYPKDIRMHVMADRTRLRQTLLNLLSNAIKYNREAGSVTVDCLSVGSRRVRIMIRDTGSGLDSSQLEQLFQPFHRLGQEGGREEGTGIGLVLTKRLVELMGGEIGVTSTPGTGSMFWVELNAARALQATGSGANWPGGKAVDEPCAPPARTILYVEDNPANLKLVQEIMTLRPDLCLLTATDGYQGVKLARQHRPDVIMMDINLPDMNGNEVLKLLQGDAATRGVPVIALTANAMPRDIADSVAAGFFRYLTKPVNIGEFFNVTDSALAAPRDSFRSNN